MLETLEGSQFSALIRTELWGWPLALTLHAFGTALVISFVLIICLRLVGMFETIPYPALQRFFVVVWWAMGLQLVTGFVLWMAKPTRYVADTAFMLKLALVVVGIFLLAYFQRLVKRQAVSSEAGGTGSAEAVASGRTTLVVATVLIWCGALVAGRLTAYLGTIYTG